MTKYLLCALVALLSFCLPAQGQTCRPNHTIPDSAAKKRPRLISNLKECVADYEASCRKTDSLKVLLKPIKHGLDSLNSVSEQISRATDVMLPSRDSIALQALHDVQGGILKLQEALNRQRVLLLAELHEEEDFQQGILHFGRGYLRKLLRPYFDEIWISSCPDAVFIYQDVVLFRRSYF